MNHLRPVIALPAQFALVSACATLYTLAGLLLLLWSAWAVPFKRGGYRAPLQRQFDALQVALFAACTASVRALEQVMDWADAGKTGA